MTHLVQQAQDKYFVNFIDENYNLQKNEFLSKHNAESFILSNLSHIKVLKSDILKEHPKYIYHLTFPITTFTPLDDKLIQDAINNIMERVNGHSMISSYFMNWVKIYIIKNQYAIKLKDINPLIAPNLSSRKFNEAVKKNGYKIITDPKKYKYIVIPKSKVWL